MKDGTFKDVTYQSGLGHTGWSLDVGTGDLNNDGWPDIYVANDFGADELYFNTGASESPPRFRIVIDPDGHPGIGNDWWKGMNVDIADVDGDGRLDIYITNILARKYKTDEGNMLWLNCLDPSKTGGCKFINISPDVHTNDGGWGWGGKFCDFNNDGLMDIFAVNGFATGSNPNNTYWYQLQEMVTQTKNNAADVRDWPPMGDRDLSGYDPNRLFIQLPSQLPYLHQKSPQLLTAGNKSIALPHFVECAQECGMTDLYNGRGIALADYDNDGDIDLYVANQGATNCLYKNDLFSESSSSNNNVSHWIGFLLIGNPHVTRQVGDRYFASCLDAIGTRLECWSKGMYQIRELTYCNGFASESDKRVHFGLGNNQAIDSLIVHWPSGRYETYKGIDLAVDSYHTIREANQTKNIAVKNK